MKQFAFFTSCCNGDNMLNQYQYTKVLFLEVNCTCTVKGEAVDVREDIICERLQRTCENWENADSDGDVFNVVNAKKHCIILQLKTRQSILQDSSKLHSAIRSLLRTIITAGDMDHNVPTLLTLKFDSFEGSLNGKYLHIR